MAWENFLNGQRAAQNTLDARNQRGLNRLIAGAYEAPMEQRQSILPELARINAGAAQQYEKQLQSEDDRRRKNIAGLAGGWANVPAEHQEAFYRNMATPMLSANGVQAPEYTAEGAGGYMAQLQAAYGGGANGTNIHSTYVDAEGNRVAVMRDGSRQVLGPNNQSIRVLEPEGHSPYGVVTSGGRAGQMVGIGGPQPASQPQAGQSNAPDVMAQRLNAYATRLRASGVPEDQIDGLAMAYMQDLGLSPQAGVQSAPAPQQFAPPRTPTAAEKAAATEQAKIDVQLRNAPAIAATEADAARQKEQATSGIEQAKKVPQYQNVERGLDRIQTALSKLQGRFVDTGPLDQWAVMLTPEGQELSAAVGAIQNDMLALTRVPGIGSQSDLEAKIANLKYPDLRYHPEVNTNNLLQLRQFISDLGANFGSSRGQQSGGNLSPAEQRELDELRRRFGR